MEWTRLHIRSSRHSLFVIVLLIGFLAQASLRAEPSAGGSGGAGTGAGGTSGGAGHGGGRGTGGAKPPPPGTFHRHPSYHHAMSSVQQFNAAMQQAAINPMDAWRRLELVKAYQSMNSAVSKLNQNLQNGTLNPADSSPAKSGLAGAVDPKAADHNMKEYLAKALAEDHAASDKQEEDKGKDFSGLSPLGDQRIVVEIKDNREETGPVDAGGQVLRLAALGQDASKSMSAPDKSDSPAKKDLQEATVIPDSLDGGNRLAINGLERRPQDALPDGENADKNAREELLKRRQKGLQESAGVAGSTATEEGTEKRDEVIDQDGLIGALEAMAGDNPMPAHLASRDKHGATVLDPISLTPAEREALRHSGGVYMAGFGTRAGRALATIFGGKTSTINLDDYSIPWTRVLWVVSVFVNFFLLIFKVYPLLKKLRSRP